MIKSLLEGSGNHPLAFNDHVKSTKGLYNNAMSLKRQGDQGSVLPGVYTRLVKTGLRIMVSSRLIGSTETGYQLISFI